MTILPFDITGPLPTGITVLEASAGTGKTYTIAALAARYVAEEGIPLEQLLLVTFTRMATGELRERVRERFVSLERSLSGGDGDELSQLLAADDVELRRERLARALADFDAATIVTTHGFCQEVLAGLGIAGDMERDPTLVEDIRDLVDEVVDDLYVRRFHSRETPPFGRDEAARVARIAIENPSTPLAPPGANDVAVMRHRLAQAARAELDARKRRMAIMTYDDQLTRLHDVLTGDGGDAAAARLQERYRVVLVDEFQDTDPVQWEIVRRAFGDGTLVLIGDPKQAIYAFRGADVYAYLEAARTAGTQRTLEVNWRSDQGLIDAYDAMFVGTQLGHEGIVYRRVRARETSRFDGTPVRIRVVHRDEPGIELTARAGCVKNASGRAHVASDLASDVVQLLSSGRSIAGRGPVGPGHVAVLVRTNRQAALVRDALEAASVPAVINGAGSVFGTDPARDWLRLLEALERPTQQSRARGAVLTSFLGWSATDVCGASESDWASVHGRLHDWARVLRVNGVASLMETLSLAESLPRRVLSLTEGERWLTDLRHVGQLLHAVASAEHLGITALTAWLRQRILEAADDTADEERSRRLESDADAVQVLTIHRSKGLQFPIVYLPFMWELGVPSGGRDPVAFHDDEGRRMLDVSLVGSAYTDHAGRHVVEERGEDLRLAYVALTRAQHQAVLWWAGSFDSRKSPLGRLLFARSEDGRVAVETSGDVDDATAVARFEALAALAPGRIAVERSSLGVPASWSPPLRSPVSLSAAVFDRSLDAEWRRTSYSDIASGAYEARVASEPSSAGVLDEPSEPVAVATDVPAGTPISLWSDVPVGLEVGTFVHRVLEATDFAAADLTAELSAWVGATRLRVEDPDAVVLGLCAALETPLGPLVDDVRLCDLGRTDRLDELEFELPLAGGDSPSGELALSSVAALLRSSLPAGDPLRAYAERLEDPALRDVVRGYLTGSIDLVLRLPGTSRFAIVDYKTNWLGPPDEPLTAWHHRPAALGAEMARGHYGLQALLYTAALHRYLRWRLPGYSPEENLAGVLYLFVRGMYGAATPVVDGSPSGVFAWRPPSALVVALSDLLDGHAP